MSDTPKTDAVVFAAAQVPADGAMECVTAEFARQQERRIAQLEAALKWAGDFPYAGGKAIRDIEPVKSALEPK